MTGEYSNFELGTDPRYYRYLEEEPRTAGQSIGDAFSRSWHDGPLQTALDSSDLFDAQHQYQRDANGNLMNVEAPRLSPDEVRARARQAGVDIDIPESGLSSAATDLLIQRKRDQQVIQSRADRAASGFFPAVGQVGAGFAASLLDPINLGLSFIPVIGEDNAAAIVARGVEAGIPKAITRAGVGFVQGSAAFAGYEPINYALHQDLQDDYDLASSLESIAWGGALAGGLHVAAGAIADRFAQAAKRGQPEPKLTGEDARAVQRPTEAPTTPEGVPEGAAEGSPPIEAPIDFAPKLGQPIAGKSAADVIALAEDYRQRYEDLKDKPGFQLAADELSFRNAVERNGLGATISKDLGVDLTPELAKAVEIAQRPSFTHTADEKLFLDALRKGKEGEFLNERLGATSRRIEQLDQELTGRHYGSIDRIREKNSLLDDLGDINKRMQEIGYTPLRADYVLQRVSDDTRRAALRAIVAQALDDRTIDIDSLVRTDAGSTPLPRATTAEIGENAKRVLSADGVQNASRVASEAADAQITSAGKLPDDPVAAAEQGLADAKQELEAYAKSLGREEDLSDIEDSVAQNRLATLIEAARNIALCDIG